MRIPPLEGSSGETDNKLCAGSPMVSLLARHRAEEAQDISPYGE